MCSITEGNVVCSVGVKGGMEEASTTRDDSSANEDGSEGSEGEGERERKEMVMVEVGKPEWDCESILRYSIIIIQEYAVQFS